MLRPLQMKALRTEMANSAKILERITSADVSGVITELGMIADFERNCVYLRAENPDLGIGMLYRPHPRSMKVLLDEYKASRAILETFNRETGRSNGRN